MEGLLTRIRESARASPQELGLLALWAVAVVGGVFFVVMRTGDPPAPVVRRVDPTGSPSSPSLLVHVAGLVRSPGVYDLPPGSRVKDAIAAAGGPAEGAYLDALNLAAPLSDGEKVMVVAAGQAAGAPQGDHATQPGGKTNLNSATQAQLEQLPGVGPVLAQRIIEYRTKNRFTSIRQLLEVEGFGQKKYESLKDLITV